MLQKIYGRILQIFIVSQSACHWQTFPAYSNACGEGKEPILELSTWKKLHSGRLQPYLQTLELAGEVCQGETL